MLDRSRLSHWVLLGGILAIVAAVSHIPEVKTMLTGTVTLSGIVTNCNKYIHIETEQRRYHTEKVAVAELIFYMEGYNKKFRVTKSTPVNNYWAFSQLEKERLYIDRADSITVWIPKYEEGEYEPTILRIEGNGYLIYSGEQSVIDMAKSAMPLGIIGVALIIAGISMRKKDVTFA